MTYCDSSMHNNEQEKLGSFLINFKFFSKKKLKKKLDFNQKRIFSVKKYVN